MSREDAADFVQRRSLLPRLLLLTFCCGHAAFLIFSIIPRNAGQNGPGTPAMDVYRLVTGGRQVWNMFEAIPLLHSLDVWLEREDAAGREVTEGCVLPGFTPYPKPEQSRFYVLFHRLLMTDGGIPFREAYLRRVRQLMQSRPGAAADGGWSLVMDAEFTRTLSLIMKDGRLSLPVVKKFDAAGATENPP